MPTGSGKTWLALQAIKTTLETGARAIYLTPLRALATEITANWQSALAEFKVGIFTGDYGLPNKEYPVPFRDAHLLVMTPERLDACLRAWRSHWNWIPTIDLLVVDELHLLGEGQRGARLEGTLSRFRRLNPFVRILGLSATLGNRQELADWLGGIEYASETRPIPLTWQILAYRKATEKPDLLAQTVACNVTAGGKSLVFVQSRRRAEELAQVLTATGLKAAHHHAGLDHETRRTIETNFRAAQTDVLVATATLEMGLNLPVRQVVLYDLQMFDGVDFKPLSTNSVWQRVGRAGRRGLDATGEAVLLAPAWDNTAQQYAKGRFEPIRSRLADPRALAEQVVAEVSSGLARSLPQLNAAFQTSLAAQQQILPQVERVVNTMQQAGMLELCPEEEGGTTKHRYRATRLGRIAVRHFLTPATVLLFRQAFDQHSELLLLDLLLIAASCSDCEPVLPVDFEELEVLAAQLAEEPSLLLQLTRGELIQLLGIDGKRLLAALRMALASRAWTRAGDTHTVAVQHNCYPFEVQRLCESLQRLLLAMSALLAPPADEVAEMPSPVFLPLRERVKALQVMMAAGIDEMAATLTLVPGLGPSFAKRLHAAGIRDLEDLASADLTELRTIRGLSSKRAADWRNNAQQLIRTHSAYRYREEGKGHQLAQHEWPAEVDPYRLRRALDLKIAGTEGGLYRITGGVEPHQVHLQDNRFHCDCADAARASEHGYVCKHVLAVRLARGERQLTNLAKRLKQNNPADKLNLFDLWYSQTTTLNPRATQ